MALCGEKCGVGSLTEVPIEPLNGVCCCLNSASFNVYNSHKSMHIRRQGLHSNPAFWNINITQYSITEFIVSSVLCPKCWGPGNYSKLQLYSCKYKVTQKIPQIISTDVRFIFFPHVVRVSVAGHWIIFNKGVYVLHVCCWQVLKQ